ncbi:unnamed protein product [Macrosiphum euphorbiae]|uniref:Uncharacterized protein n=1 Tax=Macrosiphum euphorbiae TaxID=13131 RepID=A0AAV0XYL9_9HEMI|nr:unnamed protein product [Macrosiphum euphorbiae]
MRNRLCGVVINDAIYNTEGANKINRSQFSKIAKGIEELFPSESEFVYFIPYFREGNKVSPNRGKLYDKYCNIKREINKTNTAFKQNLCNKDDAVFTNEDEILDSINWLKHNIDPEITLYKLWAETASYRLQKQSNDKNNLKYPALKNSKGHILIDMDFDNLYPQKNQNLIQKFDI